MAIIGSTIGIAFAFSFVAAPFLQEAIGVPGIFALTGALAVIALAVVAWVVPPIVHGTLKNPVPFRAVLLDPELIRLNVGIFALHAVLMALFVVVPFALVKSGLPAKSHWWLYLGAVFSGFVLMLPVFLSRSVARHERAVFLGAIVLLGVAIAVMLGGFDNLPLLALALVIFFTSFNVLEAKLPSLVSKAAPASAKGAATGVYSSVQFFGTFFGAAAGGALAQHAGPVAVLGFCLAFTALWLAAALPMKDIHVPESESDSDSHDAPAAGIGAAHATKT
jgi:predicted MFS family arabinose efflux permease